MRLPCIAIFLLAGGAGAASAAEDVPARTWAAACAACHGPEGRSEGGMPSIAGRPTQELYNLLLEFKNGKREATACTSTRAATATTSCGASPPCGRAFPDERRRGTPAPPFLRHGVGLAALAGAPHVAGRWNAR